MIGDEAIASRVPFATRKEASARSGLIAAFWVLLVVYGFARVLTVFPTRIPMAVILGLHIFPPLIFALIHGGILYRVRGIVVFTVAFLVVSNLFENVGVLTGFPFGRYYFTEVMGPKLFNVPIFIGPAYLGMGYLSWILARLILGRAQEPLTGAKLFVVPVLASFIMVAWDFSSDPVWSTIKRCWIWQDGGAYFGVPWSNFLGWYLTVYVFYQLFALYLRGRSFEPSPLTSSFWRLPVLFYGVCAAGNVLLIAGAHGVVTDPTGAQWRVSEIAGGCGLASIFTMGIFAVMAWKRSARESQEPEARRQNKIRFLAADKKVNGSCVEKRNDNG